MQEMIINNNIMLNLCILKQRNINNNIITYDYVA